MNPFCFMMHLETTNMGLRAAALAIAPLQSDDRVWAPRDSDYLVTATAEYIHVEVRFKTEEGATTFYDAAKSGLTGLFVACTVGEPGDSYLHVHECKSKGGCKPIEGKSMEST